MNSLLYLFYLVIIIILSAFIIHFQLLIHKYKKFNKSKKDCKKCEDCSKYKKNNQNVNNQNDYSNSTNINKLVGNENRYIKQLNQKIRHINNNN